jgi:hypothetical protein
VIVNARKLWPVLAVGVLVVAVVGFFAVMTHAPPGAAGASSPSFPQGLTYYGHTMVSATTPGSGSPTLGPLGCPYATAECYSSYNWGGYVAYNSTYAVSKVVASWTVPAVANVSGSSCPDAQKTWDSNSVWVGIDGVNDNTVEQTGTSSDCYYGTVQYYAWYEFSPANSVMVPFTITPGNGITADVAYVGHNATGPQFTTTITDTTTKATYTSPKTAVHGALRHSADWIDESPSYDGYLGLTHVAQVKFTGASATIGGVSHPISGWGKNVYWFIMVDYNFPYTSTLAYAKAQPSALTASGNSFTMKWISDGP